MDEVETGKRADALDRLSRDVAFISSLMARKVDFVAEPRPRRSTRSCCTFTPPSREKERALISQRTKAASGTARQRSRPDWKVMQLLEIIADPKVRRDQLAKTGELQASLSSHRDPKALAAIGRGFSDIETRLHRP